MTSKTTIPEGSAVKSIGGIAGFRNLLYRYSLAFAQESAKDKECAKSNKVLAELIEFIDTHAAPVPSVSIVKRVYATAKAIHNHQIDEEFVLGTVVDSALIQMCEYGFGVQQVSTTEIESMHKLAGTMENEIREAAILAVLDRLEYVVGKDAAPVQPVDVFQHTGGKLYEKLGEVKAKVGGTGWWKAVRYRSLEDGKEYVTDIDRWGCSFTVVPTQVEVKHSNFCLSAGGGPGDDDCICGANKEPK